MSSRKKKNKFLRSLTCDLLPIHPHLTHGTKVIIFSLWLVSNKQFDILRFTLPDLRVRFLRSQMIKVQVKPLRRLSFPAGCCLVQQWMLEMLTISRPLIILWTILWNIPGTIFPLSAFFSLDLCTITWGNVYQRFLPLMQQTHRQFSLL